jgi:hypothetical protein
MKKLALVAVMAAFSVHANEKLVVGATPVPPRKFSNSSNRPWPRKA